MLCSEGVHPLLHTLSMAIYLNGFSQTLNFKSNQVSFVQDEGIRHALAS